MGLPFNPFNVNDRGITPALSGPTVYAVDESRCGLATIGTCSGKVVYPLEAPIRHGSIRRILALLDSRSGVIELRDGEWLPGSAPQLRPSAQADMALFTDHRSLIVGRASAVVREVKLVA